MLGYEVEHQDMKIILLSYLQKQNIGVGVRDTGLECK